MTLNPSDPKPIKPPAFLTRSEKALFRTLSGHLQRDNPDFPPVFADILADYVQTRTRIAELSAMRNEEVRRGSSFAVDKARVLQLGREINSATTLSLKLADRIGLANGGD